MIAIVLASKQDLPQNAERIEEAEGRSILRTANRVIESGRTWGNGCEREVRRQVETALALRTGVAETTEVPGSGAFNFILWFYRKVPVS